MEWHQFRTRTLKCLYPLDLLHLGAANAKYYGVAPSKIILVNQQGNFYGAIPKQDMNRISSRVLSLVTNTPQTIDTIFNKFYHMRTPFLQLCDKIITCVYSHIPVKDQLHLFRTYNDYYLDSSALTWLAIAIFPAILEEKAKYILSTKTSNDVDQLDWLTILSTPTQQSFMLEEETALLNLALSISGNKMALRMFMGEEPVDLQRLARNYPKIYQSVTKHVREYGWITFDYTGPSWSEVDIAQRLKELLREDLEGRKSKIVRHFTDLEKSRSELVSRIGLTEKDKSLFKVLRDVMLLQDIRKEVFTRAHYSISFFLKKLGEELGVGSEEVRYLTADEIDHLILDKIVDLRLIKERKTCWVLICEEDGFNVFTSKQANSIEQSIQEPALSNLNELKGVSASGGTAIGRLRIIIDECDLGSMQQGEILVTKMTTPTYVVAMRKAKAILTDEGGITSHAAIVSRELGIPCIVGLRCVTSVFKSGDVVEVNANKGIIRKLHGQLRADQVIAAESPVNISVVRNKIASPEYNTNTVYGAPPLTLSLRETASASLRVVGGKALALGLMTNECKVPDGFCITTQAFDLFLKQTGLDKRITNILAEVDIDDINKLNKIASTIENLILGSAIPNEMEGIIAVEYAKLNCSVAVRSSSSLEDVSGISAAGQHDTFLNVEGLASVLHSTKRCWASLYSPRAISYRLMKGITQEYASMAVVVQRMVNATKSGVIFTADPVRQNTHELLIEAIFGLGEPLVSGEIQPDFYRINKSEFAIIDHRIAEKRVALYCSGDTGVSYKQLSALQAHERVLSEDELKSLSQIAIRLEKGFACPQDIEWAIADDIYILQSRPITTLTDKAE